MATRRYTGRRYGEFGEFDSEQEERVAAIYPELIYHPNTNLAYQVRYLPDFLLGKDKETGLNIYLECKEWLPDDDVGKYLSVVERNNIILIMLVGRLSVRAKTRLENFDSRLWLSNNMYIIPLEWLDRVCKP